MLDAESMNQIWSVVLSFRTLRLRMSLEISVKLQATNQPHVSFFAFSCLLFLSDSHPYPDAHLFFFENSSPFHNNSFPKPQSHPSMSRDPGGAGRRCRLCLPCWHAEGWRQLYVHCGLHAAGRHRVSRWGSTRQGAQENHCPKAPHVAFYHNNSETEQLLSNEKTVTKSVQPLPLQCDILNCISLGWILLNCLEPRTGRGTVVHNGRR